VRPEALTAAYPASLLIDDLIASRDAGLANVDALVEQWTPRIAIPPDTIHTYLTRNIHYVLDEDCLRSIKLFRELAAKIDALPPLPGLNILG
jgi:chorismate dehydratase